MWMLSIAYHIPKMAVDMYEILCSVWHSLGKLLLKINMIIITIIIIFSLIYFFST